MQTLMPITEALRPGVNPVTFESEGALLQGLLYLPSSYQPGEQGPVVIVTGPWTQVKEQVGKRYAEKLASLGLAALAIDYRFWGQSEGQPRSYESTHEKATDIQHAVTFLQTLSAVDADRIGVVGVCAGAGVVTRAAGQDPRIRSIATSAAWLQHPTTTPAIYGGAEGIRQRIGLAQHARQRYQQTGEMDYVPAYDLTENSGAAMFFPLDYYGNSQRGAIPEWDNQFAVMSWQEWLEMDAISPVDAVKVPVLMVHSDGAALPDNVRQFFARLTGPKNLLWTEGEHTEFYDKEPQVDTAVRAMLNHFQRTL